jgi:aminoglycoside phosphotransferase family enzyme
VNFGFLDFSTLEKRRYFSERKIELNRRLCPDVHLGVIPISLGAGGLTFGPGDVIVEYAVKTRKLEDRYFFLQPLKRKQIGTDQLDCIVLVLKAFHESQKRSEEISAWGRGRKAENQHRGESSPNRAVLPVSLAINQNRVGSPMHSCFVQIEQPSEQRRMKTGYDDQVCFHIAGQGQDFVRRVSDEQDRCACHACLSGLLVYSSSKVFIF